MAERVHARAERRDHLVRSLERGLSVVTAFGRCDFLPLLQEAAARTETDLGKP